MGASCWHPAAAMKQIAFFLALVLALLCVAAKPVQHEHQFVRVNMYLSAYVEAGPFGETKEMLVPVSICQSDGAIQLSPEGLAAVNAAILRKALR